ncbi:MAG: DUF1731 domain-containing protein [Actinomycetes bacterium]
MRVAITEGPRFWGEALASALRGRGDDVVRLSRTPTRPDDRRWDPEAGAIDAPGLEDVDAVVNLFGASPYRRWTDSVREELLTTRITGTLTVVSALDPGGRCQRLLNRSSTAFYGDRGNDELSFGDPRGTGFLARVVADWEASARHAPVPTALLRTPAVLAPEGGYLALRQGWLRGRLGPGTQYVPWVHLADWVAAALLLLDGAHEGPVNVVAPEAIREAGFVAARARSEGRRPGLPIPRSLLSARFGDEAARELWLASTRAVPIVLGQLGFEARYGTLDAALAAVRSAGASAGVRAGEWQGRGV